MMKVLYSPEAKEDLQRIKQTVDERFLDETLTKKVMRDITAAVRSLETFPHMGVEVSKITGIPTRYRYLFSRNNYIFYRIDRENIYIVRILNEKREYIQILFGISETEE